MGALQAVVGSEDVHLAGHSGRGEVGQVLAAFLLLVDLPLMAIVSTVSGLRTAVLKDQSRDQGCDDHDERHSDCDDLVNRQTWSVPVWLYWFDRLPTVRGPGGGVHLGFGSAHSDRPVWCAALGGRQRGRGHTGGQGKVPFIQPLVSPRGPPVDEACDGGGASLLRVAFPLQLPPGSEQQAEHLAVGVFKGSPPPPVKFTLVQVPRPEVLCRGGGTQGAAGQGANSSPVQRSGRVPERLLKAGAGSRHRGRG